MKRRGSLRRGVACVASAVALLSCPARTGPDCQHCSASYVSQQELGAQLAAARARHITDQPVRNLDVGNGRVGVGVVHREKLAAPEPNSVAEHDRVSEVYHVLEGSGTLVTGRDLVEPEPHEADSESVPLIAGPGHRASSIRDGVSQQLAPGDVIIIPAGTGHWFTRIDTPLTYLIVRIDPDQVTPLLGVSRF